MCLETDIQANDRQSQTTVQENIIKYNNFKYQATNFKETKQKKYSQISNIKYETQIIRTKKPSPSISKVIKHHGEQHNHSKKIYILASRNSSKTQLADGLALKL